MPNESDRPTLPDRPTNEASERFNVLYAGESREVIQQIASDTVGKGEDPATQARLYAERGKPDFALAYLLASALADDEKRAIYATSFERRAELTEAKAREFDKKFRRPFPLLATDAAQDRARARRVRDGQQLGTGAGKHLPLI